jgi:hypothetical protein
MNQNRTHEEEAAYDVGWNLAEMGHADMLDTYMDRPNLRKAFEEGWIDGADEGEKRRRQGLFDVSE